MTWLSVVGFQPAGAPPCPPFQGSLVLHLSTRSFAAAAARGPDPSPALPPCGCHGARVAPPPIPGGSGVLSGLTHCSASPQRPALLGTSSQPGGWPAVGTAALGGAGLSGRGWEPERPGVTRTGLELADNIAFASTEPMRQGPLTAQCPCRRPGGFRSERPRLQQRAEPRPPAVGSTVHPSAHCWDLDFAGQLHRTEDAVPQTPPGAG